MAENCLDINLTTNNGTSQAQRVLAALSGSYANVDGRQITDLVLFAKNYGAYLNFYGLNNTVTGDWQNMMGADVAVTIATVATWNVSDYTTYINNIYSYIQTPNPTYPDPKVTLRYLFDFIASIATALNNALLQLPTDENYFQFLTVAIGSKIAIPLSQLISYYNSFVSNSYIDTTGNSTDPTMPVSQVVFAYPLFSASSSFLTSSPWVPATTPTNINLPLNPPGPPSVQVQIINSGLFTSVVSGFVNSIGYIVNQTNGTYINDTLQNYPEHAPYYALFLSFLRLFQNAQQHLNEYTGRHKEFYYKKVLQLNNNPAVADNVHAVFQLQRNTPQYLLPAGTQLNAGKDVNNNARVYALTDDVVINQASVSELKSLYLAKTMRSASQSQNSQILYASPIANSSDGKGGKLTTPDQCWYPFGDLTNPVFTASGASVGFAIASNLLYLNEGPRTIVLTFNCTSNVAFSTQDLSNLNNSTTPVFSVSFTGTKNWFDASGFNASPFTPLVSIGANSLILTINLNGTAPAIVPYSQKIHGGSFPQALPMAQVNFNFNGQNNYYAALKSLVISSVAISVTAGCVQNLLLQNNNGKIDQSKPFKPFGDFPPAGASFIIGSKEVFQKKLTALTINITWQSGTAPTDTVNEFVLVGGQWLPTSTNSANQSTLGGPVQLSSFIARYTQAGAISPADFTANEAYKITSINGFVQLQLADNTYSLPNYLSAIQPSVTITGTAPDLTYTVKASPGSAPLSPVATSVSLSYTAQDVIALGSPGSAASYNNRQYFFYHTEPFGFREMHPFITTDPISLLPVFNLDNGKYDSTDNGGAAGDDDGGELWIGLSNTQPGQAQSILFQVAEGTANPLKNTASVVWYYMSANNWKTIASPIDATNNLSQSGLVILNLPGDETTNNTRADSGLLWLKAVAAGNPDAVCKIIAILANAAKAQFVQSATSTFLGNIPANTISKPAVSNAVIQKITQPYPSFGGAPAETDPQFDQRISERLRHKDRAVTPWDYERLVLQNFPDIYMAKCLSHTTLDTASSFYSELKPGSVMIVTVPVLSLVTGANPLLPFTNIGLLADIQSFLQPLTSPFVSLEVCNPQFEGIQLNFMVYFINNNANFDYYAAMLNQDIQQYLLPWAYGVAAADIEFGGTIEKSALLSFVQGRPYVDFVINFQMNQWIYGMSGYTMYKQDIEEAVASTARSILVPYSDPVTGAGNIISPANSNGNG